MVARHLRSDVAFMNAGGMLHFDAHFRNILTDGQRLYLADLGLATSSRFELSGDEVRFLATHSNHDACYTVTQWVNWLVAGLAEGRLPPSAAAITQRYAPLASVMNEFYRTLHLESRTALYPAEEIERLCAATGILTAM
jgi:hypothetical protein